jgi:hypothetical protein
LCRTDENEQPFRRKPNSDFESAELPLELA